MNLKTFNSRVKKIEPHENQSKVFPLGQQISITPLRILQVIFKYFWFIFCIESHVLAGEIVLLLDIFSWHISNMILRNRYVMEDDDVTYFLGCLDGVSSIISAKNYLIETYSHTYSEVQ